MNAGKPEEVRAQGWRAVFLRRLSDGAILATVMSMTIVTFASASERISLWTAAGMVVAFFLLAGVGAGLCAAAQIWHGRSRGVVPHQDEQRSDML